MTDHVAAATVDIKAVINGVEWEGEVSAGQTLLEFLRSTMGLIGVKRSCEALVCGACTVLIDGNPVSSCSCLAFEIHGRAVATVESLADQGRLDLLQRAFIEKGAVQCGFCTPGQLMMAKALLAATPDPTVEEIRTWMSGNICRCGCYPNIVAAIRSVIKGES
jgi:aerobic-type carbon monoxide dehydrogenase small subunit (CoxS/CutS family)